MGSNDGVQTRFLAETWFVFPF